MPELWYELSYDPLIASLVSGLVVGSFMSAVTWIATKRARGHCPYCCPKR